MKFAVALGVVLANIAVTNGQELSYGTVQVNDEITSRNLASSEGIFDENIANEVIFDQNIKRVDFNQQNLEVEDVVLDSENVGDEEENIEEGDETDENLDEDEEEENIDDLEGDEENVEEDLDETEDLENLEDDLDLDEEDLQDVDADIEFENVEEDEDAEDVEDDEDDFDEDLAEDEELDDEDIEEVDDFGDENIDDEELNDENVDMVEEENVENSTDEFSENKNASKKQVTYAKDFIKRVEADIAGLFEEDDQVSYETYKKLLDKKLDSLKTRADDGVITSRQKNALKKFVGKLIDKFSEQSKVSKNRAVKAVKEYSMVAKKQVGKKKSKGKSHRNHKRKNGKKRKGKNKKGKSRRGKNKKGKKGGHKHKRGKILKKATQFVDDILEPLYSALKNEDRRGNDVARKLDDVTRSRRYDDLSSGTRKKVNAIIDSMINDLRDKKWVSRRDLQDSQDAAVKSQKRSKKNKKPHKGKRHGKHKKGKHGKKKHSKKGVKGLKKTIARHIKYSIRQREIAYSNGKLKKEDYAVQVEGLRELEKALHKTIKEISVKYNLNSSKKHRLFAKLNYLLSTKLNPNKKHTSTAFSMVVEGIITDAIKALRKIDSKKKKNKGKKIRGSEPTELVPIFKLIVQQAKLIEEHHDFLLKDDIDRVNYLIQTVAGRVYNEHKDGKRVTRSEVEKYFKEAAAATHKEFRERHLRAQAALAAAAASSTTTPAK